MGRVEIYKKVLTSLGFNIKKNGIITIDGEKIKVSRKTFALELEDSDLDVNDYTFFDPIKTSVLDADPGIKKLLSTIALMNTNTILEIVRTMVSGDDKTDLPSILNIMLVSSLEEVSNSGSKSRKPIQDSTLKALDKLVEWCLEEGVTFIKPILKNPVRDKGESFKAGVVVSSPLLEEFEDTESEVHALFKRKEDGIIIESMLKSIYTYIGLDGVSSISNATNPNIVAYMKFYLEYAESLNRIIKPLGVVNEELADFLRVKVKFSAKYIEEIAEEEEYQKPENSRDENSRSGNSRNDKSATTDEWGVAEETYTRDDRDRDRGRDRGRERRPEHIHIDRDGYKYYESDLEEISEGLAIWDLYDKGWVLIQPYRGGRDGGRDRDGRDRDRYSYRDAYRGGSDNPPWEKRDNRDGRRF